MSDLSIVFADMPPVKREGYQIAGYKEADWAVSTMDAANKRVAEAEARYAFYHAELDRRLAAETKQDRDSIEFFKTALIEWGREQLKGRKTKHLDVFGYRLQYAKNPDRIEITNREQCEVWAKEHKPELIKTTVITTIPKDGLKKHLEETGELAAGCELVPGEERVTLKPLDDKPKEIEGETK